MFPGPIAVGIARLVLAPLLLAFALVIVILLTLYAGVGWIFTGRARVRFSWPTCVTGYRYRARRTLRHRRF